MGRLALVVGRHQDLLGSPGRERPMIGFSEQPGPGGDARTSLHEHPDVVVLARHGADGAEGDGYVLPHEIDYGHNIRVLADAGCDRVLAIGSVGGLRADLAPGTFVCPDDFIALDVPQRTTLSGIAAHRVPGFDHGWREEVLAAFSGAEDTARIDVRDGSVYWQVTGPRLETPAEIRVASQHADVIGMTIASECVAAGELGLRYAAICVVDNYGNGIAETELTLTEVEAGRARNRRALAGALAAALRSLA